MTSPSMKYFTKRIKEYRVVVVVVVVVAELQQERRPLRSTSTVDDGLWQLWKLI
jgi:hypothetical protein